MIGAAAATTGLPHNPRPGPREIAVSPEQFEAALRHASAPGALAMLLAHEAGLRNAAIVALTRSNCDFERNAIRGRTKLGASYDVPMTNRLRERLLFAAATAEQNEPLLAAIAYRRTKPSTQELCYHLRQAKRRAGDATPWTLHDLRRTAARRVYERTHDVRKVQRLMAHKNLYSTLWYLGDRGAEINREDLETATQPEETTERKQTA